jgi:hypothetical protein
MPDEIRRPEPMREYGQSIDICIVLINDNTPAGSTSIQTVYPCTVVDPIVDEEAGATIDYEDTGRVILVTQLGTRRPPFSAVGDEDNPPAPIVAMAIGDRWFMLY